MATPARLLAAEQLQRRVAVSLEKAEVCIFGDELSERREMGVGGLCSGRVAAIGGDAASWLTGELDGCCGGGPLRGGALNHLEACERVHSISSRPFAHPRVFRKPNRLRRPVHSASMGLFSLGGGAWWLVGLKQEFHWQPYRFTNLSGDFIIFSCTSIDRTREIEADWGE